MQLFHPPAETNPWKTTLWTPTFAANHGRETTTSAKNYYINLDALPRSGLVQGKECCIQHSRPFSNRFENRHRPSPSHHSSLIRSPRRPRKANSWPEYGCSDNCVCTIAASPSKPFLRSVTPHASQIRTPLGGPIIALPPTPRAASGHRRCRGPAHSDCSDRFR